MCPLCTPTSARNGGNPDPSTTRPPRTTRSNTATSPTSLTAAYVPALPGAARAQVSCGLLRSVTDGFDVVAIGITHEGPEVVRVVLGPDPRFVQYLGAG